MSSNADIQPQNLPTNQQQPQADTISVTADPSNLSTSLLDQRHDRRHGQQGMHHAADDTAVRAMSHTQEWKPALDRRQSWSAQEYKHELLRKQLQAEGGGVLYDG
ncbi:hypothetical protein MMYC01_203782 [Madurella mycetomatis]|uniref:Uncharacterized protein n=1 Tax=Madurella mycetomatis TaxID=100816 RepID=A0A175W812_9PEZI|nr:hypothetical protein MMYC01_203782 [Madurella mycetomatis]